MDELEMSVAKMPANVGTRTAKLTVKMQTGDESGTAKQDSDVRKVTDEMDMRVAKLQENDRDKAELRPPGGEESGTAEPENQVTDEMELSLANMPANERDVKAEMRLQGGEENGKSEPGCEVTNVTDEMELSLANMPANDRARTAEFELPGGGEGRKLGNVRILDEGGRN